MRFTLASDHHDFFTSHGYIGFDTLFSPERIDELENLVTKNTRDLWRTSDIAKTIVFEKKCAEIAAELTRNKVIRIGFDQSLCTDEPLYFGKKAGALSDLCCIQPILCGMILRLTDGPVPTPSTPPCPCPEKRGTALFFSSKMLINLQPLSELRHQKFLLVVYTGERPLYIAKDSDPSMHGLKNLGYAFGDHLTTTTHPVLYRK